MKSSASVPQGIQLLNEATFVVFDTETTGLRAEKERLLEIAAVKVVRGEVVDRFETLVNPQIPIPQRVYRVHRISNSMVQWEKTASEVLPAFVEFIGDAVLVGHHVRFDVRFLAAELRRAGMPALENHTLCTVRLARRLLRGLPRKSLGALKMHFGIETGPAHRAMADAEATYEVLLRLLPLYLAAKGEDSASALLKFQHSPYSESGPVPKHLEDLRENVLPNVPGSPGVYFMQDQAGRLLYIGKALNLRRRVGSYFMGLESRPERTRKLMRSLREITWTETPTELSAILLEHRLRKEHHPPFNRADKRASTLRYAAAPFLRIGAEESDRRVTVVRHIRDDGAAYYGPFRKRRQARTIVEAFFALYGEENEAEWQRKAGVSSLQTMHLGGSLSPEGIVVLNAFLRETSDEVFLRLDERMRAAADAWEFESASETRDWILQLEALERKEYVTGVSVYDRNAAIVLDDEDEVEIHAIRYGLRVSEIVLENPVEPAEREAACRSIAEAFGPSHTRPARFSIAESGVIHLVALWLHRELDYATILPWHEGMDPEEFAQTVMNSVGKD